MFAFSEQRSVHTTRHSEAFLPSVRLGRRKVGLEGGGGGGGKQERLEPATLRSLQISGQASAINRHPVSRTERIQIPKKLKYGDK
ncbi:hypothetical protein PoB_005754600 [Plakobranchus ocellatus]|uniref:Uncharacterized protein n=1 Tax=Plakobranchus ocellatus TaxID=259542 RepID=A0AAV4CE61_9GAST|nr:hypothetical protein PoB_005754600 [Plakobranchus ocellatus]